MWFTILVLWFSFGLNDGKQSSLVFPSYVTVPQLGAVWYKLKMPGTQTCMLDVRTGQFCPSCGDKGLLSKCIFL